jgi:hypothetical protein
MWSDCPRCRDWQPDRHPDGSDFDYCTTHEPADSGFDICTTCGPDDSSFDLHTSRGPDDSSRRLLGCAYLATAR